MATNKMLIDASHPEETRVVVLRGNRVEEFDFESANRKQLRGNIYLAKVTRVEPSLQAAFVDYGGNRHGFLAFSEIHPDYYQIPVADRQALIEEEERAQRSADAEAEHRAGRRRGQHRPSRRREESVKSDRIAAEEDAREAIETPAGDADQFATNGAAAFAADAMEAAAERRDEPLSSEDTAVAERSAETAEAHAAEQDAADAPSVTEAPADADAGERPESEPVSDDHEPMAAQADDRHDESDDRHEGENGNGDDSESEDDVVESVGGSDALEEVQERVARPRSRQYKIQEVIKRRQVMLVQVVKEERGTKGAALTTYLSLAGRYSVLMPNTARGGGISRKITSAEDRRRLKDIAQDLETPEGMGVILRTAGASRTKTEVKRDFEYLLRLWETVRDLTLKSTAPKLVYEEGSLVKRAIRDLYNKDIEDIVVAGDDAYRDAKDFMRMLMPSHAKNVKQYKDRQPLFTRNGIESQLDAMFTPVVQLKSGGYIVLNQAEALVAIDVNSGRATREHHIEDTALKTNVEAAEEIARQLRLRDLAGLIVIDFIDMEEKRNNRTVERRLKESLKHDRARIQVGRISHFGLLEMSRQRIRSSVLESSTAPCPACGGTGHVRSVSSVALQLLRGLEETLIKSATHSLVVRTRSEVALYVLNQKRAHLRALEERFKLTITVSADPTVTGVVAYVIDRGEQVHTPEVAKALVVQPDSVDVEQDPEVEEVADAAAPAEEAEEAEDSGEADDETERNAEGGSGENGHKRRRRRRRRRGGSDRPEGTQPASVEAKAGDEASSEADDGDDGEPEETAGAATSPQPENGANGHGDADSRRRRRGRRGGRGRRERGGDESRATPEHGAAPDEFGRGEGAGDLPAESAAPQPSFEQPQPFMPSAETPPPSSRAETPAARAEIASAPIEVPPEPPRRRAAVRERAPVFGEHGDAPAPSPTPAMPPAPVSEPAAPSADTGGAEAADNQPRRSGWWSRRMGGGD